MESTLRAYLVLSQEYALREKLSEGGTSQHYTHLENSWVDSLRSDRISIVHS